MSLRRKLLTAYTALAVVAIVVVGVSFWTTVRWRESSDQTSEHYERSLLLQRVRATTFHALKEVPDAVAGGDPDAREEFEALLAPADADFAQWAELARDDVEREQVRRVRVAFDVLVADARTVFDLLDAGRRDEAIALAEGGIEDQQLDPFEEVTAEAVASDRANREVVSNRAQETRRTARVVLALAAFGTLSLVLLIAAYLASDLFSPLRGLREALEDLARGNLTRRLDEERGDEFGAVARAFNGMADAFGSRQRSAGLLTLPSDGSDGRDDGGERVGVGGEWSDLPTRATLHAAVAELRSRVVRLGDEAADVSAATVDGGPTKEQSGLVADLDRLSLAVARLADFGFPLDLNLARTDVRALLYEVLLRFHDEFARRAISFELDIAPEVGDAVVDRLKLRESLGELVRNGLAALPAHGGRLGLRSSMTPDGRELVLEVADNGVGMEQPLISEAFAPFATAQGHRDGIGLRLTRAIVEQHGGRLEMASEHGRGTHVSITLPMRA